MTEAHTLLTAAEVCARLSIARSTLYELMKADPTFPRPLKLGAKAIRFRASDVAAWIDAQAATAA